jgi:hypothetical protein
MKRKSFTLAFSACLLLAITLAPLAHAARAGDDSKWIGLWQSQLDGQPGVTLTLGDDTGQLGGGVVFHVVSREGGQPHVIGNDAHVLMNPRIEGDTLRFKVIRRSDKLQLEMTMRITADGKAAFHCANCEADALIAEMVRSR